MCAVISTIFAGFLDPVADRARCRLPIQTRPPLPSGRLQAFVRVELKDEQERPFEIPVLAHVVGYLEVTPSELVILDNQNKRGGTRSIETAPGKVKNFKLLSVDVPSESIHYKVTRASDGRVMIRLDNLHACEEIDGTSVHIFTDVEKLEKIEVPIRIIATTKNIGELGADGYCPGI